MIELGYERAFREWAGRAGYGWEKIRYPRNEAGGDTVAYRMTPTGAPRAVVLAVHGAGNDALFALVGLFKELLGRGYEVFTFDLDGHGRASTTLFGDAVRGAVPAAVARTGAAQRGLPVHAIGISLGGAILLASLANLPSPPRSASLLSAPLRIHLSWAAIRREVGKPLLRTLWRERSHYGFTGLVPSFGPFKRGSYPLRLAQPPGPGPFGYVEVLNQTLERLSLEEAARRASIPVLLAYGRRDLLVPAEQAERLAQLLPRAELLVLDGETHLSAPMAPPAVYRVLSWIEEHG
ncbi:MAG: alpha/beta hydrolase [Gemmatimonadetes bacterium]|nr:alpha/beta hydrolase [Gemmatimonadota bacterium]